MTHDEHRATLKGLESEMKAKREAMKKAPTLAAKLAINAEVKDLEAKRHSHQLHYFDLVDA